MQRELGLQTIKFFISRLIPALLLTLINIIYSRYLSRELYGSYQAIWTYLNVFVIFTAFGFPKYILSIPATIDLSVRKKLVRIFLFVLILFLSPIAGFFFYYQTYFNLSISFLFILLLISQTIYFIQEAIILTEGKSQVVLFSNLGYGLILFLTHLYVLFIIPFELFNCLLGITVISILRNIYIILFKGGINLVGENSGQIKTIDFSLLFWLGLNDGLQILTKWMDKLFLLFLLTASEFAIYYNGTFELPLIGMLLMSFQTIITIYGAKRGEDDDTEVINLFNKSSLIMSSLLFPLFGWMFFFSESIIIILFGNNYSDSSILFQLSSLLLPIRICSYTVLLQLKNKGKTILTGGILDFVVTVLLIFLLYPFMKLNGLVIALVLGTYFQVGYYVWAIKRVYQIKLNKLIPIKNLVFRFALTAVIFGLVKFCLGRSESIWIDFVASSCVVFILFIYFTFDSFDLMLIKKLVKKKK